MEIGCATGFNFALLQETVGPTGRIIGLTLPKRCWLKHASDGLQATRPQVQRLRRDVTAIAGENGVAMAEQKIGRSFKDLTKEEASGHIESLVKTGKLAVA